MLSPLQPLGTVAAAALAMWLHCPFSHPRLPPPSTCPPTAPPASFRCPGFLLSMKPLGCDV
ncbi:hypothetical protein ZEAMMB73_Zm00001d024440 [Zea mays]|uniref:Uncharacterized protein n=1 Tax=Zea mays TaxID=4577 RepID=A0A1D6IZB5_MAIZE|nr:hypothetical protein ZEAMMB73_Zm00001d024440 [Zea mays]